MPFPHVIDNTIRKALAICQQQAAYKHIDNIQPTGAQSVDLHFGRCFASGIEAARRYYWYPSGTATAQEAVEVGKTAAVAAWGDFRLPADSKSAKTLSRLVQALTYYFEQWPLGEDGLTPVENGIECSFDFEIPIAHPDDGVMLRYAGRPDMLAQNKNKRLYVVDEKTASRLGDSWTAQWDLDTQMTGYIWGVQQQMLSNHAAMCDTLGGNDGWHEPEFVMPEIVAQIRAVSIGSKEFGHVEIPIVRPDWVIQRWYRQMLMDVERFKVAYVRNKNKHILQPYSMALHGNACTMYNRDCDYKMLCMSPNPERLVAGNYQTVVWDPLERGKK